MRYVYVLLMLLIIMVSFLFVWRTMIYTYSNSFQSIFDQLTFNSTPSDWNSTANDFKNRVEPYLYNLPYLIFFIVFMIALAIIFSRQTEGQEYTVGAYYGYP